MRVGSTSDEIGGEFHLQDFPCDGLDPWPVRQSFFGTGRAALIALCRRRMVAHPRARLFVPDYFCPEVVSSLRTRDISVLFYTDHPAQSGPELERLPVAPWDMVLAVNYFGVRSGDYWGAWRDVNPAIALIEDHSHDPQSRWAQSSNADFAFASLRKTIPVPDGAVVWSPRGLPLPEAVSSSPNIGSALKLAAMIYKRRYLDSGKADPELKAGYLELQAQGEEMFSELNCEAISAWSQDLVCHGMPSAWRRRREYNVRSLLMRAPSVLRGRPLFDSWPAGHCPFNPIYVFDDETAREVIRGRLISAQVYTPVHWRLRHGAGASLDLSKRILTIPLDFRCSESQIARIASILKGPEPPTAPMSRHES